MHSTDIASSLQSTRTLLPTQSRSISSLRRSVSKARIYIIIVYYAEAAENIKHTHTIHAYTTKQFKHTNKNTYNVKSIYTAVSLVFSTTSEAADTIIIIVFILRQFTLGFVKFLSLSLLLGYYYRYTMRVQLIVYTG